MKSLHSMFQLGEILRRTGSEAARLQAISWILREEGYGGGTGNVQGRNHHNGGETPQEGHIFRFL